MTIREIYLFITFFTKKKFINRHRRFEDIAMGGSSQIGFNELSSIRTTRHAIFQLNILRAACPIVRE